MTPNFTYEELTRTDHRELLNVPDAAALKNLDKLALFLEEVRALIGRPIIINSAYRSPEVNKSVGGAPTSQHVKGQAADFRVIGMTPDQITRLLHKSKLPYDQLIREFDSWTHISIADKPRKMALIIDRKGVRQFV